MAIHNPVSMTMLGSTGTPVPVSESGMPIVSPSDYAGTMTVWDVDDVSNTVLAAPVQPIAGARVVSLSVSDAGSSAIDALYVVFNAIDAADAAAKAASSGTRHVVNLGERRVWAFEEGGECTSIYYVAKTAEAGANTLSGEYVV